jgi:glycosyltransferase involved in cell wall biosynthesis
MISRVSSSPRVTTRSARPRIRLLAIMEGSTLTGPAKNLLEFCRIARELDEGPIIEPSLVFFQRLPRNRSAEPLASHELMQEAVRDNIQAECIPERYTFDHRVIGRLREVVDRVAPDVIQTHMFKSHFLVRACGLNQHRAWVAFFHGYTRSTLRRDLLAQLDRWSLRAPSQVVAVSDSFARKLALARGIPRARIMVLHNAIDSSWLTPGTASPDIGSPEVAPLIAPGEKLLLAVGRLSKEKGFPDLIAAFSHLKKASPALAVRLAIVGEGLERPVIEEAVRRAGLEPHVSLVGQVKDVRPYYRAADLMVIPSLSEGSPNALLEAMAAGVPVVSTAVGGIPEIVSHGETALLVPPRDPVALANAMQQLLSDPAWGGIMAGRARELIATHYSPWSRAQTLVSLYQRLCSRTHGTQPAESPAEQDTDATSIPGDDYSLANSAPRNESNQS